MTVDELLELSDDDQKAYLNGQIAAGKTAEEVYADLQTCASDMARLGFFVVAGSHDQADAPATPRRSRRSWVGAGPGACAALRRYRRYLACVLDQAM